MPKELLKTNRPRNRNEDKAIKRKALLSPYRPIMIPERDAMMTPIELTSLAFVLYEILAITVGRTMLIILFIVRNMPYSTVLKYVK